MIRLGTVADLAAASGVYRRASLSNAGDRDNLLAHPEYLILGPEGLAEGRTHVAEEDGSVVGFATWAETAGTIELEDLFVDPDYMRRGIATALVNCIAEILRARGAERLEVTANPHAKRGATASSSQQYLAASGFTQARTIDATMTRTLAATRYRATRVCCAVSGVTRSLRVP